MRIQQSVFREHLNKEQVGGGNAGGETGTGGGGGIAPLGQQRRSNNNGEKDSSLSTFDGKEFGVFLWHRVISFGFKYCLSNQSNLVI